MTTIPASRGAQAFIAMVLLTAAAVAHGAADYHGVPPGPAAARRGAGLIAVCSACHGGNGVAIAPIYPDLAGQQYNYILKQLEDFRSGRRSNSIMSGMAMTIPPSPDNRNLEDIAAYFATRPLTAVPAAAGIPAAELGLGREIYTEGLAARAVPACAACHGIGGEGNGPMAIPALALQHRAYVVAQLQQFASGVRSNDPGHVMHVIAARMNHTEQAAVAAYVRQLDPRTALGIGPKTYGAYARALTAAAPQPPRPAAPARAASGPVPAAAVSTHATAPAAGAHRGEPGHE